jgi:WD40 repeat protein
LPTKKRFTSRIRRKRTEAKQLIRNAQGADYYYNVAWSPNPKFLAVASNGDRTTIFNAHQSQVFASGSPVSSLTCGFARGEDKRSPSSPTRWLDLRLWMNGFRFDPYELARGEAGKSEGSRRVGQGM